MTKRRRIERIILDERQLCDLEMLLDGSFAPLYTFLNKNDYECVLKEMRLSNGNVWPIPIVLRVLKEQYAHLLVEENIPDLEFHLLDSNNQIVAKMTSVNDVCLDVYEPDIEQEFNMIYGCSDDTHDYIKYVKELQKLGNGLLYIGGGLLEKVGMGITHYSFNEYRLTPTETKSYFKENNWKIVLGFQTRNPMHRSHFELTKYAMDEIKRKEIITDSTTGRITGSTTGSTTNSTTGSTTNSTTDVKLLLHPVIGVTQSEDVPYEVRARCYIKLLSYYDNDSVKLSFLPLSMRMAGPREALWHALVRQNYGCTHFVVGRDHAGPSSKKYDGTSFFGPYDSHELLQRFSNELTIKIVNAQMLSYVPKLNTYLPADETTITIDEQGNQLERLHLSGTKLRELLKCGEEIPEWFTFPEVSKELKSYYPPMKKQGFCVYLFGLSGCGKTTLSKALIAKLREKINDRHITLLDGDIVRDNLGQVGFSRKDRSFNVRRIGYLAQTIVKNRGICVCANIAPYREDREYNRKHIDNYFEIYLSTPITVCEERDVKGLYKKARAGEIHHFTGIDDPFEVPENGESDLVLSCTSIEMINSQLELILEKLNAFL